MDITEYKASDFEVLNKIGTGSYGSVYRVRIKKTGEIAALKTIEMEEGESMEDALVEIQVLRDCDSPYVTRYLNCYRKGFDQLFVVMELCEVGSVMNILSTNKMEGFPEPTIAYIMYGVLKGLEYLHKSHKIHRDIKGGNVLCNNKGEIKLADFGITAMLQATWGRRNTFIGSPYWMAPEMLNSDSYDLMIDIWSTGITGIELAISHPPYSNLKWQDAIKIIANKDSRSPIDELDRKKYSDGFISFLECCLKKDPKERYTIPQLLEHPFIKTQYAPLTPQLLLPYINQYYANSK